MELLCAQANARCKTHVDAAGDSAAVRDTTAANVEACRKCGSENDIVMSVFGYSVMVQREVTEGEEGRRRDEPMYQPGALSGPVPGEKRSPYFGTP